MNVLPLLCPELLTKARTALCVVHALMSVLLKVDQVHRGKTLPSGAPPSYEMCQFVDNFM